MVDKLQVIPVIIHHLQCSGRNQDNQPRVEFGPHNFMTDSHE